MTENKTTGLKLHNENLNKIICESLQQALLFLMNKQTFSSITITALCKKAGVSRVAFYNNYNSKEDLLEKIVLEHIKQLIEKIGSPFREYTNADWYSKMLESVKEDVYYLKSIFNAGFKHEYLAIINKIVLHNPDIPTSKKYLRVAWVGGVSNIIIHWLENGMQEPISEIAEFCYKNLSV